MLFTNDQENTQDRNDTKLRGKEHLAEGQGTFLIKSFGLCVSFPRAVAGSSPQGELRLNRKYSKTKGELHLVQACCQVSCAQSWVPFYSSRRDPTFSLSTNPGVRAPEV